MSIARAIIVGFVCFVTGLACGSLGGTEQPSIPAMAGKNPDAEADRILTSAESQRRAILKTAEADRDRIVREAEEAKEQLAALQQQIAQARADSLQPADAKGPAIEPTTWGFKPIDRDDNFTYVSWQIEFANRTNREIEFLPQGSLIDAEGFEVERLMGSHTLIAPFGAVTITGKEMVKSAIAPTIVGVKAKPVPR